MDNTIDNINAVRYQIAQKINYNKPFYAYGEAVEAVITDMDHFPYKRFFRGVYHEDRPVIFEREAGYRPRRDCCYKELSLPTIVKPEYCWESPCSFIKPCKSKCGKKNGEDECNNSDCKECANYYVVSP
jgi:hypothetical protein